MDERDYEELNEDEKMLNTLYYTGRLLNDDLSKLNSGQLYTTKEQLNLNKNRLNNIKEQSQEKIKSTTNWLIYHICFAIIQTLFMAFIVISPISTFFLVLHIMCGILDITNIVKLKEFENTSKKIITLIDDKILEIQDALEKRYIEEKKQEKINIPEYMLNIRARYEYEEEQEMEKTKNQNM